MHRLRTAHLFFYSILNIFLSIICSPGVSGAYPAVHLLESRLDTICFSVDIDLFEKISQEADGRIYLGFRTSQFGDAVEDGTRLMPMGTVNILLPPRGDYSVDWKSAGSEEVFQGVGLLGSFDGKIVPIKSPTTCAPVRIETESRFRNWRILTLRISPVHYDEKTGCLRLMHHLRVYIRITGGRENPQAHIDRLLSGVLSELVINPERAEAWQTMPTSHPAAPAASALPDTGDYPVYKIFVSHDGIIRLTNEIDFSAFDPNYLTVFNKGKAIPIYIRGENDGVFDPGDYIEFYAEAYRDGPDQPDRYTKTNVYWLTWTQCPGIRILPQDAAPDSGTPVTAYYQKNHYEQNNLYFLRNFYWERIGYAELKNYPFDVNYICRDSSVFSLRIKLTGFTSIKDINPDHHVIVYFNDVPVQDSFWDGTDSLYVRVELPITSLREGTNTISINNPGDTEAGELDVVLLDWFEISYPRYTVSDGKKLEITNPVIPAGKPGEFSVLRFDSKPVSIYRLDTLRRLENYRVVQDGAYYVASFSDPQPQGARYIATLPGGMISADAIRQDHPSHLKSVDNAADYLIITHRIFADGIQPLAQFHEAQGLRVRTVRVEDIYDEFNYGIFNPEAITDFCRYAYANWTAPAPAYLLLVGDACWDYKMELPATAKINYVPAYGKDWTEATYSRNNQTGKDRNDLIYGDPMIDDLFACVSGDDELPDMAVGRFPVETKAQLAVLVEKTLRYESQTRDLSWQNDLLFIDGGFNDDEQDMFARQSETIISDKIEPFGDYWKIKRIYKETDDADWGYYRDDIINAIDSGNLLINFFGHAGTWSWESMFDFNDIALLRNRDRLPFIASMTCNTARFANPEMTSFGEAFVTTDSPDYGCAAFWGGCNFGGYWSDYYLATFFYDTLMRTRSISLGNTVLTAKIKALNHYPSYAIIIEPYTLLGDPALGLNLPSAPIIKLSGFQRTHITSHTGGLFTCLALVSDPDGPAHIDTVELLYENEETGLFLYDDGAHGDYGPDDSIFGLEIPFPPDVISPTVLHLGIRATDMEGNQSRTYPFVKVD